MTHIKNIEGIGPDMAEKLARVGVTRVDILLERAATRTGRRQLAEECDIPEKQVLRWTNMADLFRIKGIGEEYAELLEAAGVDTVPSLARRNAEYLWDRLAVINRARRLTRRLPSKKQLHGWVEQAKSLPRVIEY